MQTLLQHVGVEDPLFSPDALKAVASLCGGSPRILGNLLEKALILGAQHRTRCLDADCIRQVHEASALFVR